MMKQIQFSTSILIAISIMACNQPGKTENLDNEKIPVVVTQLDSIRVNHEIKVSGNAEGSKTVKLGFMVAGKVNFIALEEGESIRAGKLLASLDPENYRIAKDIADATLEQVTDEYNRLSQMHERKSLAESDFVKISSGYKQAKAQQKLHAKNLNETKLIAPIDGVLLKKLTEVGEIIGVGLPLFVLSDIDTIRINAAIPENEIRMITPGDSAEVYLPALDSSCWGTVTEIAALAEATTRSFNVKIAIPNPKLLIRPGMTAEATLFTSEQESLITIPVAAILHDIDGSSYVYLLDQAKGIALKRSVMPGQIRADELVITSGLAAGDLLIIAGQHKVNEGVAVEPKFEE